MIYKCGVQFGVQFGGFDKDVASFYSWYVIDSGVVYNVTRDIYGKTPGTEIDLDNVLCYVYDINSGVKRACYINMDGLLICGYFEAASVKVLLPGEYLFDYSDDNLKYIESL